MNHSQHDRNNSKSACHLSNQFNSPSFFLSFSKQNIEKRPWEISNCHHHHFGECKSMTKTKQTNVFVVSVSHAQIRLWFIWRSYANIEFQVNSKRSILYYSRLIFSAIHLNWPHRDFVPVESSISNNEWNENKDHIEHDRIVRIQTDHVFMFSNILSRTCVDCNYKHWCCNKMGNCATLWFDEIQWYSRHSTQ